MAYTFAAMPEPQSATAQAIVNAINSIQTAINDLDARLAAANDVTALESRVTALETQDTATASDLAAIRDDIGLVNADIAALQAGGVPNAITSPDGSVTSIEVGTIVQNNGRTGLPASHILLDRG